MVEEIILKGVQVSGFKGELVYIGGNGPKLMRFDNCVIANTNADALNPGGIGRWEFNGGRIANAHQAAEGLGGALGSRMSGTIIEDCDIAYFTGGPDAFDGIHSYAYGSRDESEAAPWLFLDGVDFRNVTSISMGSWVRGNVLLTDSQIAILGGQSAVGQIRDIKLDVQYVADRANMQTAVVLYGPGSETVPVTGGAAGEYVLPPANIDLRIDCSRTELAEREGRQAGKAFSWGGIIDAKSCRIRIGRHVARNICESSNKPPISFPLIQFKEGFNCTTYAGRPDGALFGGMLSGDAQITPAAPWVYHSASEAGTYTLTMQTSLSQQKFGFRQGQRIRIGHNGSENVTLRFLADGAGMRLRQHRLLQAFGDYLELEFSEQASRWIETGFKSAVRQRIEGVTTFESRTIAAGSSHALDISVAESVPGDLVEGISLDTDLPGLVLSASVDAAGLVTAVLNNQTAQAVTLPGATLRVVVAKATT